MKRKIFLIIVFMFIAVFAIGCGAKNEGGNLMTDGSENGILTETSRKIYYIVNMDVETSNVSQTIELFTTEVTRLNGYVSSSSITENQSSNITFRVPTEKLNEFLNYVNNDINSNVSNKVINSTDVTTSYNEIDARLEILYTSRTSYLNLLEKATTLSDIIMIQTRIEEIDTEILRLEKEKGSYDNLIEYSTINMNINDSGEGFFSNYLSYLLGFITVIGVVLLYLLPVAIITVLVVIIVKKVKKNKEN